MDDSKLLPKLPIPFGRSHHRDVYSAIEMHEYARAAIATASKWPATSINTEEFRKLVTAYMKYADSPDMTSGHYAWSQLIDHIDSKMKALNIAAISAADHQETGRDAADAVERAARAMALHIGWDKWDTATDFTHTHSGNDPDEERDYFRDLARAAFKVHPAAEQDKDAVRDMLVEALKDAHPYIDNPHVRIKIGAALKAAGAI